VGGVTEGFVWNLAKGLPAIIQDGSTKYVTGPGGLPLEQVSSGGTVLYYYQDQLGSTRGLLDASGTIVATYTYDAYGNLKRSTGSVSNPFQYAGQYTDSESGLQYLRARYYDPSTQQFLTVDPLVGATGQPYSYAGGDALNAMDPTGLACAGFVPVPFTGDSWSSCKDHVGAAAYGAISGVLNSAAEPVYSGASAADTNCLAQQAAAAGTGGAIPYYDAVLYMGQLLSLVGGAGEAETGLAFVEDGASSVPNDFVVVRGGISDVPPAGQVFSGAAGPTLEDAASGVPHGTIRSTNAGDIRGNGELSNFRRSPLVREI
jgi:RHS repeat-associated protein